MTNSKATRKALLGSVVALLLCFTMLMGATFAWFTDNVSSTGNRIQSGDLEVDLVMDKLDGAGYKSIADGTGDIFSEATGNGINWEPGKTEIVYLGVRNNGSLALKYNILLNIVDNGLIGSLEFAILDGVKAGEIAETDWASLKARSDAQTGDIVAGQIVAAQGGILDEIALSNEEFETDYFALAVHMKEEAGNEYEKKSITIDVQVVATQKDAEEDSFGPDYDEESTFNIKVSTADELVTALNKGGSIEVQDDIVFTDGTSIEIPEGTATTLSLNGHTLTNPVKAAAALINKGSLTINGGTIVNENIEAQGAAVIHNYGSLVLNNVNVGSDLNRGAAVQNKGGNIEVNGGFFATMTRAHPSNGYAYVFINNSGAMTINNAEVNGFPNGIFYADAGTIDVNGGKYIIKDGGNTWYVAYAGGTSKITLNSGEYHWYKLFCDAATTGNVVVSNECTINW